MHLDIVSAEEEIFSGNVKNIIAAAMMGEVGIFPKHTPMITPLKPGEVKIITDQDEEKLFFISGGVLEVQPDIVTVLADTAIRAEDLDEAKAAESKKRAEEALADKSDKIDAAKALAELAQAAAQLKMIETIKRKSLPIDKRKNPPNYSNQTFTNGTWIGHGGYGGQFLLVNPDTGISVSFFSVLTNRTAMDYTYLGDMVKMMEAIALEY